MGVFPFFMLGSSSGMTTSHSSEILPLENFMIDMDEKPKVFPVALSNPWLYDMEFMQRHNFLYIQSNAHEP